MVKNTQGPCRNCADRHVGCHGRCEKYKAWQAEHEEYLEAKRAFNRVDCYNAQKACDNHSKEAILKKIRSTK